MLLVLLFKEWDVEKLPLAALLMIYIFLFFVSFIYCLAVYWSCTVPNTLNYIGKISTINNSVVAHKISQSFMSMNSRWVSICLLMGVMFFPFHYQWWRRYFISDSQIITYYKYRWKLITPPFYLVLTIVSWILYPSVSRYNGTSAGGHVFNE